MSRPQPWVGAFIALSLGIAACSVASPPTAPPSALGGTVAEAPFPRPIAELGSELAPPEALVVEESSFALAAAAPLAAAEADGLRLAVPYRSQLDGSPWAPANCGPTTLGMGLASLGVDVPSAQLRRDALDAQRLWGDTVGTRMEALAQVAERHGVRVVEMREGGRLKRWTLDDIRAHLEAGRPVVVQVFIRALPGRKDWPSPTDHYLIITGLVGDEFLYQDSMDSDGPGMDRRIGPAELQRAMDAGERRYAYAGFALAAQAR